MALTVHIDKLVFVGMPRVQAERAAEELADALRERLAQAELGLRDSRELEVQATQAGTAALADAIARALERS